MRACLGYTTPLVSRQEREAEIPAPLVMDSCVGNESMYEKTVVVTHMAWHALLNACRLPVNIGQAAQHYK